MPLFSNILDRPISVHLLTRCGNWKVSNETPLLSSVCTDNPVPLLLPVGEIKILRRFCFFKDNWCSIEPQPLAASRNAVDSPGSGSCPNAHCTWSLTLQMGSTDRHPIQMVQSSSLRTFLMRYDGGGDQWRTEEGIKGLEPLPLASDLRNKRVRNMVKIWYFQQKYGKLSGEGHSPFTDPSPCGKATCHPPPPPRRLRHPYPSHSKIYGYATGGGDDDD